MNTNTSGTRTVFALTVCIVASILTGCETPPQFERHAELNPSTGALHREIGGLVLVIDPLLDESVVKRHFAANLHQDNILPVFVAISNQNSSASCVVSSESFAVVNGEFRASGGEVNRAKLQPDLGKAFVKGFVNPLGGGLVGGFGNMFAAHALQESDYTLQNQNLRHMTLRKKTLSPGTSVQGYVFLPMPAAKNRAGVWVIIFTPTFLGQTVTNAVAISFQWASQ